MPCVSAYLSVGTQGHLIEGATMYLVQKVGESYTVRSENGSDIFTVNDKNIALDIAHILEFARRDRISRQNITGLTWPTIVDSPINDRRRSS